MQVSVLNAEVFIDCLEDIGRLVYREWCDETYCQAMDKAIAAAKKTVPQKVKRDPFGVECPNCGRRVVLPSTYTFSSNYNNNMIDVQTFNNNRVGIRCDYCYSCGQALDWRDK